MKKLVQRFMALGRRDRFVYGMTAVILANIILGCLMDTLSGRKAQAFVQAVLALLSAGLFVYYRKGHNYTLFIYGGIAMASIGYNLLLYLDQYVLHSYLILIVMPLVFFFLLPLKQALAASLMHYVLTVGMSGYAYWGLGIESGMFEKNAIQVYTFGAIFIVALGIFYQLAIEESYRQLQHANAQKELLLREIHHRIKNNLNKMSSALGLQILRLHRGHADDPEEILRKNKLRIEAMSLVHEALYRSEDIGNVPAGEYITKLIELIEQAYGQKRSVRVEPVAVTLSADKILRLGTLLNELYTNTLKHTQAHDPIRIVIHLEQTDDHCTLLYQQKGHSHRIDPASFDESHGLGMMLVRLSVQEMGGNVALQSTSDAFELTITFPC